MICDEEAAGHLRARYLVEEHRERFEGIRYAIGEFGGFSINIGGRRFYPIMVAEKQVAISGLPSMARFLQRIQSRQLPFHITPETMMMFQAIGSLLPPLS